MCYNNFWLHNGPPDQPSAVQAADIVSRVSERVCGLYFQADDAAVRKLQTRSGIMPLQLIIHDLHLFVEY